MIRTTGKQQNNNFRVSQKIADILLCLQRRLLLSRK